MFVLIYPFMSQRFCINNAITQKFSYDKKNRDDLLQYNGISISHLGKMARTSAKSENPIVLMGKVPFFCVASFVQVVTLLGYLNHVQTRKRTFIYLTHSQEYDYDYRFNKPQHRNKKLNQAVQCEQANFVVSTMYANENSLLRQYERRSSHKSAQRTL